jgi:hypothetical protein
LPGIPGLRQATSSLTVHGWGFAEDSTVYVPAFQQGLTAQSQLAVFRSPASDSRLIATTLARLISSTVTG